jgi:hypothetical protein
MKKAVIVFVAMVSFLGVLAGCNGTVNTTVMPNVDLKKYKTVYVDVLKEDEFNLGAAIMAHMGGMGFVVKQTPLPDEVTNTDLLIKYDYFDGWDMRKYMQRFNVNMFDAKTNTMLLNSRYALTGIWRGEEFRINYTFNDIRVKTGYPPLADF